MHAISFLLKRAHLCTTNEGQRILYDVPGMTPARFDILCFLRQRGIRWGLKDFALATQRSIRKALGLHPSTISKMLKRLEEMGWISRDRDYADRRVKAVELTKLGLRKAWEAMRIVHRGRTFLSHFEMLARNLRPTEHVLDSLDHLYDTLDVVALGFGDESTFYYDYGSHRRRPFFMIPSQPLIRWFTPRDRSQPYGPVIVDPPPRYPTPYQRWVAPLLRDQAGLLEDRRRRAYPR